MNSVKLSSKYNAYFPAPSGTQNEIINIYVMLCDDVVICFIIG
ncbi:MAG: hypothetical protein QXW71_05015 [Thermoplasmata archaeon]